MSLAALIADALVLRPSRRQIGGWGKRQLFVPHPGGRIEVWTHNVRCDAAKEADLFVLKFSGTSGRAERSTHWPLQMWRGVRAHVWSVNPPGYGGSSGRASLQAFAQMASAVYRPLQRLSDGRPILVTGNSLGAAIALHVASRYRVDGLILRNPPPLRQLILGRHGWWNLWLGASLIAGQIPEELCSITNAGRCDVPAVFVLSRRDRTVPRRFSLQVARAYVGPKRVLRLHDADHYSPLTAAENRQLRGLLAWLAQDWGIPVPSGDLSAGIVASGPAEDPAC